MVINQENIDINTLPAMLENFTELRARALTYIQQSGSANWTDHNVHDPGITIMEAICYALSDLGFRMNFPIQDLLTDSQGAATENAYYLPSQILPNHAVTIADFRKLLIDISTVKNAWITPVLSTYQGFSPDYEPMYVYEKEGDLLFQSQVLALPITNAEKQEIINNKKIFLQGLYAINIQFEPQPLIGNIDSGESFEGVYESAHFGDVYMDIFNWKELVNNKLVLKTIKKTYLNKPTDIKIIINNSPKNKYNNNDGKLDDRVLTQWYYELEIQIKNVKIFTLKPVLFETYFEDKKGISGKELKEILTKTNFGFFKNMFEKIRFLADAYNQVENVLHQNRNLCEDFLPHIAAIPTMEFRICADIDVDSKVDLEQVQAEIYYKIEQYISPTVPFYSFAEMQAKGLPIDEILEGPLLKNGFTLVAEMGPDFFQTFSIYLSDIINAIYEIDGLINVRNVSLFLIDELGNNIPNTNVWEVNIPDGFQPVLNKRKSKFTFFKNQLPLLAQFKESIIKYNFLNINAIKIVNSSVPDLTPKGTFRDLAKHYTLADEFPATYHVGKNLPDNFLNIPKYYTSKQLEGYLLHFDQVIANFLTDLNNLRNTLSWNTISHTQFNSEKPEWRRSFLVDENKDTVWQNVVETELNFLEKRNHSLDFLLARFAENLQSIDNFFYLATDNLHIDRKEYFKQLIDLKQKYLSNYISISANRGAAINYHENPSYLATIPAGYEQRIARLLGCDLQINGKRKTTIDVDETDKKERGYFHVLEQIMLRVPALSAEMKQMLQIKSLVPNLLSICTDDDCTACGGHDPYSFTASVALPAWLPIYKDIQYRDYAEQLIRRETPIGVLLRICWIDKPSMAIYEQKLEAWWGAKRAFSDSEASTFMANFEQLIKAQNDLVKSLKAMRSDYPQATLHGCEDEGEENNSRIFLNKTILGEREI